MNEKQHYLITLSALFFLGLIISNQSHFRSAQTSTQGRINMNSEVLYRLD